MPLSRTPLTNTAFYDQMDWANISIGLTGEVLKGPAMAVEGTTDLVFEHMVLYDQDGTLKIKKVPVQSSLAEGFLFAPISHPDLIFRPDRWRSRTQCLPAI